jgi:hypothetical protein
MIRKKHAVFALALLVTAFVGACGEGESTAFVVSDSNLSGVIGGVAWEFAQGDTDAFFADEEHHGRLYSSTYTACEGFGPSEPKVLVRLPKTPGEYILGANRSATFFEPPSDNTIAMEGRLEVYEVSDTLVKAGLHAVFDSLYTVNGKFEVEICTE